MKRVDKETVEALRVHAKTHPEDSYAQMAATFGISEISIKRYCADIGRGKDWRKGRKQASNNGERFWASVGRAPNGCWPWKGCRNGSGYGTVHFDRSSQGTHRVAYTLTNGPIPEGIEIDHLCRNRACCNPSHLEAITHEENMARVRKAQAEKAMGVENISSGSIDPGLDIDTRPTSISAQLGTGVSPLINVDTLNPVSGSPGPVSVSIGPGVTSQVVDDPTPAEDRARGFHDRAEDIWGQCPDSRQRKLPDGTYDLTPDSFSYYLMKVDGVEFKMIARSELDARLIVKKYWGVHPRYTVEEVVKSNGYSRALAAEIVNIWTVDLRISVEEVEDEKPDEDAIDTWLGDCSWRENWSRRLGRYFDDWEGTEPGKRWVALQELRRKEEQDRRMDEAVDWYEQCVEAQERRSKPKLAKNRTHGANARRPAHYEREWDKYDQGAEWEGEEFESDDFEED